MDIKTDSDLYFFEDLPGLFQVYRLPGAAKKRRANEGFGGGGVVWTREDSFAPVPLRQHLQLISFARGSDSSSVVSQSPKRGRGSARGDGKDLPLALPSLALFLFCVYSRASPASYQETRLGTSQRVACPSLPTS